MKYVVRLFVNELVTIGLCFAFTLIASMIAVPVAGISNYADAYSIGWQIGTIGAIVTRILFVVVAIVTIICVKNDD